MSQLFKGLLAGTVIMAVGYGLMVYTVPTESALKEKIPPHLLNASAESINESKEKNRMLMKTIFENANSDRPIWDVKPTSK
ncbi:hypothetical protein BKA69DRAFT_1121646 [Paraphysoderma sedebokerense]|nr:hypothetical protein BKA69DRAFT_1121646 [Paraphysoderma sedebokerense]